MTLISTLRTHDPLKYKHLQLESKHLQIEIGIVDLEAYIVQPFQPSMHVPFFVNIAPTERTQARISLHCSRWRLILGLRLCDTHNCSDVGFSITNHSLATEAVE